MTETGTPDVGFIKKRDGRSERFDGAKIVEAMRRAFEDVADEQAAARANFISRPAGRRPRSPGPAPRLFQLCPFILII